MSTTRRRASGTALAACLALPAMAQDLSLPTGAELLYETEIQQGTYALPKAPWSELSGLPFTAIEGAIVLQGWRVAGRAETPFQLIAPLRDQLAEQDFSPVLDCPAVQCGGFDFRFATLVLPAPHMFVDLTAFHFLSAQNAAGDAVSVLASHDNTAAYIQIIRAGQSGSATTRTDAGALRAPVRVDGDLAKALETTGHAVLNDLVFQSGSASLGDGGIASLDALADYLRANPSRRILFVGHTDATGSLDANKAVSLKRAQAAVTYLRSRHSIPGAQISAQGAGYLSPIATNLTPEGREANRRVEAVLLSTE